MFKWPAKSPDMNSIEHLWSIIDNKLKSRRVCSMKQLTDGLSAEWLVIEPELCNLKSLYFQCHNEYRNAL